MSQLVSHARAVLQRFGAQANAFVRRLSLRARLVLGVVVLAAVGLVVADVATYLSLRSFLFNRTDSSLDGAHLAVEHGGYVSGRILAATAPGDFIQVRDSSENVLAQGQVPEVPGGTVSPSPRLPDTIGLAGSSGSQSETVRYFTAPAVDGGGRWRVRAWYDPGTGLVWILAASLHDVDGTLHRLFLIELLATVAVLAAIVGLGLWVVRLGLRPLDAIGKTAASIAAGDLTQRVERAEERTEVGRLGLALNAMLAHIEASDRRLRRFVADASHELRTPLAAVRAYAELFGRGAEQRPDDLARSMTGISRESERMSGLVDDLLLLARLDEGRPLDREPLELEEVAAEAVETARAVEPGRPIELEAQHAAVLGDRDRLRQVMDNLLGNVRAHTPAGTPVQVRVSSVNGDAVLEVEDAGPGIPSAEVERVFERFYRGDPSRSRRSGGAGLGLSIVAAVAEAHGGTVAARSEPGHGAAVRVTLPLYRPSPPDAPDHTDDDAS